MRRIDLQGKIFERLSVIDYSHTLSGRAYWNCVCSCGVYLTVLGDSLRSRSTKSCGCLMRGRPSPARKPPGVAAINALLNGYVQSARSRNLKFELTRDQFKSIGSLDCYYCGTAPRYYDGAGKCAGGVYFNGIDRLDSGLGYIVVNCVPCCKVCNYAKSDMGHNDFLKWVSQVFYYRLDPAK